MLLSNFLSRDNHRDYRDIVVDMYLSRVTVFFDGVETRTGS